MCVCLCVCVSFGVGLVLAGCCVYCQQPVKLLCLSSGTPCCVCVHVCVCNSVCAYILVLRNSKHVVYMQCVSVCIACMHFRMTAGDAVLPLILTL